MMIQFRNIDFFVKTKDWLANRMLFISGPRQVGKTTYVKSCFLKNNLGYFNWDDRKVRAAYQEDPGFFADQKSEWLCFDEIHKRSKWKDILKGIYDVYKDSYRFVVTGSASLDVFKKSGDSLVGRYFNTHIFPLNLGDFNKVNFNFHNDPKKLLDKAMDCKDSPELEHLLEFGGFPEPYFQASQTFWRRWSKNHKEQIIREDLRDLSRVQDLDKIELLSTFLEKAVNSPVNCSSFARDLETDHNSVKRWLNELYKIQMIFPVQPYTKKIRRLYLKDKKWYFMDWKSSANGVFENYVASSLYRAVTLYNDRYGINAGLFFVKTHDGAEVDFLITIDGKPYLLVEAKEGQPEASKSVYRFSHELNVPCVVVTSRRGISKKIKGSEKQNIYFLSWGKLGQLLP